MNLFQKILILAIISPLSLSGKNNPTNDWLNPEQKFFEIKIEKNGIYRIEASFLKVFNTELNQLIPENLQLYSNGELRFIFLNLGNNNLLDQDDYLEFYGEKNKGHLDSNLYSNPKDHLNKLVSLISDTSYYYLSYSKTNSGKYFKKLENSDKNGKEEKYFLKSIKIPYKTEYNMGESLSNYGGYLSDYTLGEGYLGEKINKYSLYKKDYSEINYLKNSAPSKIKFMVLGRSIANENHALSINIIGNNGYHLKKDYMFKGYNTFSDELIFEKTLDLNIFSVELKNNSENAIADNISMVSLEYVFPSSFDLLNQSNFEAEYSGNESNDSSLIQFSNSSLQNPILLDITFGYRIQAFKDKSNLFFKIPNSGKSKFIFLYDSTNYIKIEPNPSEIKIINLEDKNIDFLIISSKKLALGANEYLEYKKQCNFKPILLYTEDLYPNYYYGQNHPLALKNLINIAIEEMQLPIKNILLIGKGQTMDRLKNVENFKKNYVPCIGTPMSDLLYLSNSKILNDSIGIGRLSAESNQEILNYLEKIKIHNSLGNEIWRKRIIHISGGETEIQTEQWKNYLISLEGIANNGNLGVKFIKYHKDFNKPIPLQNKEHIINELNTGVGLLTYFGHGANLFTEINFGKANELSNKNKFPIYFLNGCSIGNIGGEKSLGEEYIYQKNAGSIGVLATSEAGFPTQLNIFCKIFYENLFNSNYGKSIGHIIAKTKSEISKLYSDPLSLAHLQQYIYQGDPSIVYYSPKLPDFELGDKEILVDNLEINRDNKLVKIKFQVNNIGKITEDSIEVNTKLFLGNQTVMDIPTQKIKSPQFSDYAEIQIPNKNNVIKGKVDLQIQLNPERKIAESNYTNNTKNSNFFVQNKYIHPLFPINYSIVNSDSICFIAQESIKKSNHFEYSIELDTNINFRTKIILKSLIPKQKSILKWSVKLNLIIGKTYYWRIVDNGNMGNMGNGEEINCQSFTYLPDSSEGIRINSMTQQVGYFTLKNLEIEKPPSRFLFTNNAFRVIAQTRGDKKISKEDRNFLFYPGQHAGFLGNNFEGITLVAIHPKTFQFHSPISKFNINNWNEGYSGQFLFNINKDEEVDSMIRYIEQVPDNYHVMGLNGININLSNCKPSAISGFEKIGLNKIEKIKKGEPYIFFGIKGITKGLAEEYFINSEKTYIDPQQEQLKVEKEFSSPWKYGELESKIIGPALKWEQLKIEFENREENEIEIQIRLIGLNQVDSIISIPINNNIFQLEMSQINPEKFPFMQLKLMYSNKKLMNPPSLNYLQVNFTNATEGSIDFESGFKGFKNQMEQGDTLALNVDYTNIGSKAINSILVKYEIINSNEKPIEKKYIIRDSLSIGESTNISYQFPTETFSGKVKAKVEILPTSGYDLYPENNELQGEIEILADQIAPILFAYVGGKKLKDNDKIGGNSIFEFVLKDENKFLKLLDTQCLKISILGPEAVNWKILKYELGNLEIIKKSNGDNSKTFLYRPKEKLVNGKYTLKFEGKDASGNSMTEERINFIVQNESGISEMINYPNPFTQKTRFIYTLLGNEVPDKLQIKIYTISGKLVKTITEKEFGPIFLGENISDYYWDGRDDWGDTLARGIYLYKTEIWLHGKKIRKETNAYSEYFSNSFGKMIIL